MPKYLFLRTLGTAYLEDKANNIGFCDLVCLTKQEVWVESAVSWDSVIHLAYTYIMNYILFCACFFVKAKHFRHSTIKVYQHFVVVFYWNFKELNSVIGCCPSMVSTN